MSPISLKLFYDLPLDIQVMIFMNWIIDQVDHIKTKQTWKVLANFEISQPSSLYQNHYHYNLYSHLSMKWEYSDVYNPNTFANVLLWAMDRSISISSLSISTSTLSYILNNYHSTTTSFRNTQRICFNIHDDEVIIPCNVSNFGLHPLTVKFAIIHDGMMLKCSDFQFLLHIPENTVSSLHLEGLGDVDDVSITLLGKIMRRFSTSLKNFVVSTNSLSIFYTLITTFDKLSSLSYLELYIDSLCVGYEKHLEQWEMYTIENLIITFFESLPSTVTTLKLRGPSFGTDLISNEILCDALVSGYLTNICYFAIDFVSRSPLFQRFLENCPFLQELEMNFYTYEVIKINNESFCQLYIRDCGIFGHSLDHSIIDLLPFPLVSLNVMGDLSCGLFEVAQPLSHECAKSLKHIINVWGHSLKYLHLYFVEIYTLLYVLTKVSIVETLNIEYLPSREELVNIAIVNTYHILFDLIIEQLHQTLTALHLLIKDPRITINDIITIVEGCPLLTNLTLHKSYFTNEHLLILKKRCPQLKQIEAKSSRLTDDEIIML
jgi:hypothetical protein